jgi:hypothetical protein
MILPGKLSNSATLFRLARPGCRQPADSRHWPRYPNGPGGTNDSLLEDNTPDSARIPSPSALVIEINQASSSPQYAC